VIKQHQIRTDPHGSMMPPICEKKRKERIFQEDILECELGTKADPFQKRHQLGSDFDRLRSLVNHGPHILYMMPLIVFVESIHPDPSVLYILVVVNIQKHLSHKRPDTEISAFISAPRVGIFAALRHW